MTKIEDYIKLPLVERQKHLNLSEACIERGGRQTVISIMMRGVLAYSFDTTIPSGAKICACHACNNWKCSNILHVYWGTASENYADSVKAGQASIWEKSVKKYGLQEALAIQKRSAGMGGRQKAYRASLITK